MTREELDFIGSMNMCDEISNEAYKKIVCHCEEQEPCEDVPEINVGDIISRQAVLDKKELIKLEDGQSFYCISPEDVETLPPVTPQPKWIPVSERLPKENKTVIVSTKYGVYPEARYTKEYGWEWAYESGADYWRELGNVTAWMPLPKQYEPQESEE